MQVLERNTSLSLPDGSWFDIVDYFRAETIMYSLFTP